MLSGLNVSYKPPLNFSSSSSDEKPPNASASPLPPGSRVFVRNLSHSTTDTSLKKAFTDFGQIVNVTVARDEDTKKSKGFAFVQYSCQDEAISAIEHMDHKVIDGRFVHVEIAKPSRNQFSSYPRSTGPPFCSSKNPNS